MTRIIRDLPEPITEIGGDRTTTYTKEIITYDPEDDSLVIRITRGWVSRSGQVVPGDHREAIKLEAPEQQARVRTAILQTLDEVKPRTTEPQNERMR